MEVDAFIHAALAAGHIDADFEGSEGSGRDGSVGQFGGSAAAIMELGDQENRAALVSDCENVLELLVVSDGSEFKAIADTREGWRGIGVGGEYGIA